jgi:hypothetical protein
MRSLALIAAAMLASSALAQEPRGKLAEADATIARGLAFLAKDALAWKNEYKCAACHHGSLVLWSMREAKQHGVTVDESALTEITGWVAGAGEGKTGVARPADAPKALNHPAVFAALALGADAKPDAVSREGLQRMLKTVESDQLEGGFWSAWAESRQPIFNTTDEGVTAMATLAVIPAARAGDALAKAALDKGIRWLTETKASSDPQITAIRLIVWRRMERLASEWEPLARDIKNRQNADGGWSQTKDMPSDAWATGQSLYALAIAGIKPDDPIVAKARAFLTKTQRADGSWPMTSRPIKPGSAGSKNLVPITCAGSAWAILGLVRSR